MLASCPVPVYHSPVAEAAFFSNHVTSPSSTQHNTLQYLQHISITSDVAIFNLAANLGHLLSLDQPESPSYPGIALSHFPTRPPR